MGIPPLIILNGPGWLLAGSGAPGGGGADRPDEQLGDVDDFEAVFGFAGGFLGVDGVAEHDHAVGAGGGDGVGVQGQRLVDAVGVDALADAFFQPHAGPAGAAAEAAVLAAVHLLRLGAGHRVDDLPRRGVDLVVQLSTPL
jgi:hypothetical protein